MRLVCGTKLDEKYYCLDSYLTVSNNAVLEGTVSHIDVKPKSSYLYLEHVSLQFINNSNTFLFSDFLILAPKEAEALYTSGNQIQVKGKILSFQTPSAPGQFNEKNYYKEMNIYYKLQAESIILLRDSVQQPKQLLYDLRDKIAKVYQSCMQKTDAGILSAMLLGEKSLLDADIKSLYQINGIGHILAISGLHITILCTIIYRLAYLFYLPPPIPFIITVIFLFGYGSMTGFGISTTRAIIMILLPLLAKELGRYDDPPSAMAFSAICILLQKPYALFSSSFLLSYSAAAGVQLIYPVLKQLILGSEEKQAARIRKRRRREKELLAELKHNYLPFKCLYCISEKLLPYILMFPHKAIDSLLFNISIQLTVLPVLLYFFYEVPTYGILLNLFVIPLVSVVVSLALAGGLIGLIYLPLADSILFFAAKILDLYELFCNLVLCLPQPVQVFGRPSTLQIICYYLMLLIPCFLIRYEKAFHLLTPFFVVTGMLCLLYRSLPDGLRLTMLDVGQGDGIFLQTESGNTILIDGGSTSVSQVGKYRILPYLKYYGIRKIDYLLMTHPDEDHISGQQELMESCHTSGIKIGCYLVPHLPEKARDSNYQQMISTAQRAEIPIYYIYAGDELSFDTLHLVCLHPDKNFCGSTANSYSVTLSLSYKKFSMLLTGDLEAEGEEMVLQKLETWKSDSPYTVLKVAHHGSKNSTSEKLLELLKPQTALISCGENNSYGHPHKETLSRLENAGSIIMTTSECGAITLEVKDRLEISGYKYIKK